MVNWRKLLYRLVLCFIALTPVLSLVVPAPMQAQIIIEPLPPDQEERPPEMEPPPLPEPPPAPPGVISRGPFNLASAYPCRLGTYPDSMGIVGPGLFTGVDGVNYSAPAVSMGAAPGILSFMRTGNTLNANCFVVVPAGQVGPCVVQSYRLLKIVPGSRKCPDVYGMQTQTYFQFGTGVRTWWSLNFTQPGTLFILEVLSVCRTATTTGIGEPQIHRDRWIWRVVADVHTLRYVIELMHGGAVSTLEVPCIIGEDMYDALIKAQERLRDAIISTGTSRQLDMGNAIFDMEALIVANCLFTEVLNPLQVFPGPDQFGAPNYQPPGNQATSVRLPESGMAVAGIIDTVEHPCCCKLLVDLEYIALIESL